ncbi:MAG: SDR family NAD(P)-dependent oxidoreductase [bacterium]|nr:SDR family NAD(P)-dependent oxidoreductase [bacterium]
MNGESTVQRTGGWDDGLAPDEFCGIVCLVTGAAQGIGLAIAKALAELGGRVVLADINGAKVAETTERLRAAGFEVTDLALDVRDTDAIDAAFTQLESGWGSVEVLVNNAGIGKIDQSEDLPDEDWDLHVDVMLSGTFKMSRRASGPMLERGSGAMVNLCSIGGYGGHPQRGAYNAAKGGIRILTEVLATEWAPRGVRVNAIAPAVTRTEMTQEILDRAEGELRLDDYIDRTPLGRIAETEEQADVVAFLASRRAAYITGQIVAVDGGWLASDGFLTHGEAQG